MTNYDSLMSTADTIDNVVEKIKSNYDHSYKWYSAIGKNGCIFQLGGRNYRNNLELKAYISEYDTDGFPVEYNGMMKSKYGIDEFILSYPTKNVKLPDGFDLIEFIKEHDFRTYEPKITSKRIAVKWENIYTLKL